MPKIHTCADLPEEVVKSLKTDGIACIDAEFTGLSIPMHDRLSLVQICGKDSKEIYLIQPNKKYETPSLVKVLEDPNIQIIGIDTYGSVFKKYHETGVFDENEIYPYITEGIGEDILPKNVDFDIIDHFEKVTDKDAAIYTRKLAKEEGIFVGNSAGAAICGIKQLKDKFKEGDVVVVLFHDHGSRYVGKFFNDDWMRDRGFIDTKPSSAIDIMQHANDKLITIDSNDTIQSAIERMTNFDISQMPVIEDGKIIGSVNESKIFSFLFEHPDKRKEVISSIMNPPFPEVNTTTSIEDISKLINKENGAVIVKTNEDQRQIITKQDIIKALA